MKTFTNCAAQGDLMIRRVATLPEGLNSMTPEGGNYIVAHSETGHHHVLEVADNVRVYETDDPMVSYLEVVEATDKAEAVLKHLRDFHTHDAIRIDPGIYQLRRQREYTPEGMRRVQD